MAQTTIIQKHGWNQVTDVVNTATYQIETNKDPESLHCDSDNSECEQPDDADQDDPLQPTEQAQSRNPSTRRAVDTLNFIEWMRVKQQSIYDQINEADSKPCEASDLGYKNPIKGLKIITSPREYQMELFERAKKQNVIAVLPTGTGKTLIAVLLLRHVIEQELESRRAGQSSRISVFLVDKVTLAFQQHRVLKENLDQQIGLYYGDFKGSRDSKEYWQQETAENMVMVCTAAVLYHCLHCAFVQMDQINLIVFDEAHHTKKKHPYAQIIKDFYAPLEVASKKRPKIFGMTASPVDAKTDIHQAVAQLEALLHSEIATVADPSVFQTSSIHQPKEGLIEHAPLGPQFETPLWRMMSSLIGDNGQFLKLLTYSKNATAELGRWCADRIWALCFTDNEKMKIIAKTGGRLLAGSNSSDTTSIDDSCSAIEKAYETVVNYSYDPPGNTLFHVSSKVLALQEALRLYIDPEKDRCIVFVEQRLTAVVLADLFGQPAINIPGLRPGKLLGSGGIDSGESSMTISEQTTTIKNFLNGKINCLFATSIGEEGLDIPDCNMIVRFDLCKTMIQHIQSRGRGRQTNSRFFHVVELGNPAQAQSIFDNRDNEFRMQRFCNTLPEDRLIGGKDIPIESFLSKEKDHRSLTFQSTGAKLTYPNSLVVLAHFVSTLPNPMNATYVPEYITKTSGRGFRCEVLLPEVSPIQSAIGNPASSKRVAKCAASFEMCYQLIKSKYLDENLQPKFKKQLPAMRNARLAISSKKKSEYAMRVKPQIWNKLGDPKLLYATVLKLSNANALGRHSRPLVLLTRLPLPPVASFPLYFGNNATSLVHVISYQSPATICRARVDAINHFTLRLFRDIFSKEYESDIEKMPYFIAPLSTIHSHNFTADSDIKELIDWACLEDLFESGDYLDWEGQPDAVYENKFVVDPHDGSRKFYTHHCNADLIASDPQLPQAPKGKRGAKKYRDMDDDIWNYSVSLFKKSRARISIADDLKVVEAEYIPIRRNLLDKFERVGFENLKCYLVFQTLKISLLPIDVVAMAYNLPAILFRLESNLIVLEACAHLDLDIRPDLALEAMTKDSDNSDENSEEKINFQEGMGKNYERLEFLGDSFLKMSTTIAIFCQKPEGKELEYHIERMLLTCNKNLFNNGLDLNLEQFIRSKTFNRRIWYPQGLVLLKGKQNSSKLGGKETGRGTHALGDKSIADVCEALIGAAYLTTSSRGHYDFDMAVKAVTKFTKHESHNKTTYNDLHAAYKIPNWQSAPATAAQLDMAQKIEAKLGYRFHHPRLLRSAFTHSSYPTLFEQVPNYQRLEFLGDALLDMMVVDHLFRSFPSADPQWMTEHKMAIVSNQFLGCLCVYLGLHKHMLSMGAASQKEVVEYVGALERARDAAIETTETADRRTNLSVGQTAPSVAGLTIPFTKDVPNHARNFWIDAPKPPKALPDLVEAYMGALFVDSGFDYNQVKSFFDSQVIRPWFQDIHLYDTFASNHPVTHLGNLLHLRFGCAHWRLLVHEVDQSGQDQDDKIYSSPFRGPGSVFPGYLCALLIHGKVYEHAVAQNSGRHAKAAAARRGLDLLENLPADEFSTRFGCNCRSRVENNEEQGNRDEQVL